MVNRVSLIVLTSMLLLSACSKPAYEQAGIELSDNTHQNVKMLADEMLLPVDERLQLYIEAKQYRLLAYNSLEGVVVPGYKLDLTQKIMERFGVQMVPAMGDAIYDEQHRKLQAFFIEYAAEYNRKMVDYVQKL